MFEDLEYIKTKDRNDKSITECLRTIALVRYASLKQLKTLKYSWVAHVAQNKIFRVFLEFGYLEEKNLEFFYITLKALKLLNLQHFLRKGQLRHRAEGVEPHQRLLTDILLKKIQEPDFYTIFYPNFTKNNEQFLRPDAGIFYLKDGKYKLTFIEVEHTEKGERYLIEKNEKYREIAKSISTYNYLKGIIETVGLKAVEPEQFCFGVECWAEKHFEWEGWEWQKI